MAKIRKTTLLVKLLTKSFYVFWPPLYIVNEFFIRGSKVKKHSSGRKKMTIGYELLIPRQPDKNFRNLLSEMY